MEISSIEGGFVEKKVSDIISEITFLYDGRCTIQYEDGSRHVIRVDVSAFNTQFGIPVSFDNKLLFVTSWETGIVAIYIETGEIKWHYRSTRITSVTVYPDYIALTRYGYGLLKIDCMSGKLLGLVKGTSFEYHHLICGSFLLIDKAGGNMCIADTASMQVTKSYRSRQTNPNRCLAFSLGGAYTKEHALFIFGREYYPHGRTTDQTQYQFDRKIDDDWSVSL